MRSKKLYQNMTSVWWAYKPSSVLK